MDWKQQWQETRLGVVGYTFGVLTLVVLLPVFLVLILLTDQGGFFPPGFFCGADGIKPYCYELISVHHPEAANLSNPIVWNDPNYGEGYCLNLGEQPTNDCWRFSTNINRIVSFLIVLFAPFLVRWSINWILKSLIALFKKNNKNKKDEKLKTNS